MAAAQPGHYNDRHNAPPARPDVRKSPQAHHGPAKVQAHRYARGQKLPQSYRADRYHVRDYKRHGLKAPPRGHRWQKVNNDYVLVALATGLITSVIVANR